MADNLIKPVEIPGGAVYGVAQHDYNVKDAGMRDYAAALSTAAFKQTLAVESTASAYAAVVRQRQRKVEDIQNPSWCLAVNIMPLAPAYFSTLTHCSTS